MSRFPFSLASDIVCEIFSHLDQEDCLQCMRVCQQWLSEIPHYATKQWERIVISPWDLGKINDCMVRCLGPHTQDVSIIEMDAVVPILNKLKDMNCVIRTLDISNHEIDDEAEFLSAIKQFSHTLKDLSLYNHESELSVPQLLGHFPNLTHLALEFTNDLCAYLSEPVNADTYSECNPSSLTSLHLDACLHFEDRIVPILRCCPKLQYLVLTPTMSKRLPADALDRIFQLCPDIHYFKWNDTTIRPSDYREVSVNSNGSALQTFIYRGNVDVLNLFTPILEKSEHTLEFLRLANQFRDVATGSSVLSRLRFPRVKTLGLVDMDMSATEWFSLLSGFEDVQSLYLFVFRNSFPLNRFAEIISRWKNLQRVEFGRVDNITSDVDVWDNIGILSNNSQLQSLDLQYVRLTNSGLLDICKIRSLKHLYLWIWQESDISLEGLLEFADKLKEVDHGIEDLELGHFKLLDDSVLARLANVRSLSWVSILCNDNITSSGVKAFICNSGNQRSGRTVHTLSCKHIDRVQWNVNSFS